MDISPHHAQHCALCPVTPQQWPHWGQCSVQGVLGGEGPGPVFPCLCTGHLATNHSCPWMCWEFRMRRVVARLGTAEGGPGQAVTPSALLCSPVPKQDRTPPRETSASDVHLWPLRPAWGEETSMADGWVDAQEGLVESGSQMGQGNCGAGGGGRGIAVVRGQTVTLASDGWSLLKTLCPGVAHQSR